AGGRRGDHRRHHVEGARDGARGSRGGHVSTDVTAGVPEIEIAPPHEPLGQRLWENLRGGNLGSAPVIAALGIMVLVFGLTASNFFSAVNFNNIITQMAGTTLLAYGIVFVLLIGEIDLSVSYVSGVAGVLVAELQLPGSGHQLPGLEIGRASCRERVWVWGGGRA